MPDADPNTDPNPTPNPAPDPTPSAEAADLARQLEEQRSATSQATAAYLDQVRTANPAIPPALIAGDDIAAINASVETAKATVQQVLDANKAPTPQPAPGGNAAAPARAEPPPVPDGTRGAHRIRLGLDRLKEQN